MCLILHVTCVASFNRRVPIIGGKDLDLHKLFKEVTSRGGISKVCYFKLYLKP